MTRANKTRSALLTSILSLLLCVSMLVGTTFAWFTDTASTGVNTIKSGNLDIVLEYLNADEKWEEVTKDTLLFNKDALYEPGYTEVAYLRIRNNGSLNLKYTLSVDVANEVTGINKAGQPLKLSDYIQFGTVTSKVNEAVTKYETREAAQAAVVASAKKLQTYTTADYIALAPQEAIEMALVVFMPTTVGNEANHNGVNIPSITMGVSVFATQKDAEEDSYGSTYDQEAPYLEDAEGNVLIADISQLFYFAKQVNEKGNSFSGKTVKLTGDIDLAGYTWTPIGATGSTTFDGTFDGQDHTISNLNINTAPMGRVNAAAAGLFGWIENHSGSVTVKNLTIDGVTVKSGKHAGAVVGYINAGNNVTAAIENCTVKNATVSGTRVGGVAGFMGGVAAMTGCKVETAAITGTESVGEITGYRYDTNTYTNNTATNVSMVIAGQEAFEQAITDGMTDITLAAGNYTMVSVKNKTVNISGTKDAILSLPRNLTCTGATIHFKGITVAGDTNPDKDAWHTEQLKEAQKATYTDCTVKNLITTYCPSEFTRCVFENNAADQYSVFCYVDGCVFTDCTFNTECSKAIKLFSDGTGELTLTVNGCTFNAAEVDKAAIEINSAYVNGKYTVHINNCTVNGNYTKLWNDTNTKSEVYVDGKLTIGSQAALLAAIANAKDGDTIYLAAGKFNAFHISYKQLNLVGTKGANGEPLTKFYYDALATDWDDDSSWAGFTGTVENIVFEAAEGIEGNGSFTNSALLLHDNSGSNATFKNCKFVNMGMQSSGTLTVLGCTFEGNGTAFKAIAFIDPTGDLMIDGCTFSGYTGSEWGCTVNVQQGYNSTVTIQNSNIKDGAKSEIGALNKIILNNNQINEDFIIYFAATTVEQSDNTFGTNGRITEQKLSQ